MKYACYETVATRAEKNTRMSVLRQQKERDPRLSHIFIDVVPAYDFPRIRRTALQSLLRAAEQKRFDTLVIPSYENLKFDEHFAMITLLQIRDLGIRIALEQPAHTVYDTNIIHDITGMQINYLLDLLEDPRIADSLCYVDDRFEPPFVYLAGDYAGYIPPDEARTFRELVLTDPEADLCLYRRDRDAWFYIPGSLKEELARIHHLKHYVP